MTATVSGIWLDARGRPAGLARVDARDALRGTLRTARTDLAGRAALALAPGTWDVRVVLDVGLGTRTGEAFRAEVFASDAGDPGSPTSVDVLVLRERSRVPAPAPAPAPPPPPPSGGSALRYVHVQDVAAAVWPVAHGLGVALPAVTVADTLGREVEGAVVHHDLQSLTITFGLPVSGTASISA